MALKRFAWAGLLGIGVIVIAALALMTHRASAMEATPIPVTAPAVDLSAVIQLTREPNDRIQVSTAPGRDGIVRRIEVRAQTEGESHWAVFALSNPSDEQIDRLLVAPFYRLADSGTLQPDLGTSRIASISSSHGFAPDRQDSSEADVFLITLDPGAVVTFVAELRADRLPQLTLWRPDAYTQKVNSYTLYRGMILGISGLLALFLTILFVVKGTVMFPATAALAWAVLGYLCIDFGFLNRIFRIDPGADQVYRATMEVMLAATLVMFLYAYLNLNRWHVSVGQVMLAALVVLVALMGVAVFDPSMAAGIARIALASVAVVGAGLVAYLALHGFDRAIMLIPTWTLFVLWLVAAGVTVSGGLINDLVQPALAGGLVLIVMLIAFTVMQHAFAGGGIAQGIVSDMERRALALVGAGDVIWDWDVARDSIWTSREAEDALGLARGALEGPARDWLTVLHPQDRDRFRAALDAVVDQRRGRLSQVFRLRGQDGHHRWFQLRARPVLGSDGEVLRCVGTLLDVTDVKTAEERLLHDAVHDNLTGLPNRELFLDRISAAIARAKAEGTARPIVFLVDIDRFKQVNEGLGVSVGDSMLLTVARRLTRVLKPQDTLARVSGDQFGLVLLSENEPERVAAFAETLRKTIKAPITFGDREVFLTPSIGIAMFDGTARKDEEILKDAEVALYHAKKLGGDRIEAFRPSLRQQQQDLTAVEAELRRALEREELSIVYQPIVRLADGAIAGFEALARWDHPKRGRIPPAEFIPVAERSGLIIPLGLYVLERAAKQLQRWQEAVDADIFCSVNVSSPQILRHDLINDVKAVLTRATVTPGTLKIEVTETLVMENPEYAAKVLGRIRDLGARLSLDDFGTGYSSLAYLQRFPFDTIKIDRQFVTGVGKATTGKTPAILTAVVHLAKDLQMEVVAEGVESEADAVLLKELGCDFAQGFFYGQPMTGVEAERAVAGSMAQAAQ